MKSIRPPDQWSCKSTASFSPSEVHKADARFLAPKSIHGKLQIIHEDIDKISSMMKEPLLSDTEYQKLDNLADVAKDAALDL